MASPLLHLLKSPGNQTTSGTFDPHSISGLRQLLLVNSSMSSNAIIDERSGLGTSRTAQPGRAYQFDSVNDYVNIGDGVQNDIAATDKITITAWVYLDTDTAIWDGVVACRVNEADGFALLVSNLEQVFFQFNDTVDQINGVGGQTLSIGQWYHIAATYDGTDLKTYVDTILDNTSNSPGKNIAAGSGGTYNVHIGALNPVSSVLPGKLFDVRIYDKALSSDELTHVYTFGASGTNPGTTNLVGHYKCDDTHTTTAYDSSGNGNHGTKTNITASTFHYEGNDVPYSWQNEVGFTDDATNGLVPRNEANTAQDVLGATLEYSGKTPINASLVQSNCATLDGTNDYITIASPSSALVDAFDDTFTIEGWLYIDSAATSADYIFDKPFTSHVSPYYQVRWHHSNSTNTMVAEVWRDDIASTYLTASISSVSIADQWSHCAMTVDITAGELRVYLDGVEIGSDLTSTGTYTNHNHGMAFGSTFNAFSGPLNGRLADWRVYNKTLSAAEVLQRYQGTDVTGVVGHWPFSEGTGTVIHDASGNANHGTAINTTESAFWGNTQDNAHYNITQGFDPIARFDGTDDFVEITSDGTGTFDIQTFSIAMWFKPIINSNYTILWSYDFTSHTPPHYAQHIRLDANGLMSFLWNFGGGSAFRSITYNAGTALYNNWHHLVVTFTSGSQKIYLDGAQVSTGSSADNITYYAQEVWLGNSNFGIAKQVEMADVRFYDKVLSADEVTYLHSKGASGTDPTTTNLLHQWLMNEGSGSTIYDNVGSLNATANNISDATFWVSKIPADGSGNSILTGNPVSRSAGTYHNSAETNIDLTGGIAIPGTSSWETAWSFHDTRTNPLFNRERTTNSTITKADRFLAYDSVLSGNDLTNVQNYTATIEG